jgi:hypothetical protein
MDRPCNSDEIRVAFSMRQVTSHISGISIAVQTSIFALLALGCGLLVVRPSIAGEQFEREAAGLIRIDGESARSWTDCFGSSVEAKLVGVHGATILLMVDGNVFHDALAGLSDDDLNYITSALERRGRKALLPGSDGMRDIAGLRLSASEWIAQLDDWAKTIRTHENRDSKTAEHAWNRLRSVRDPTTISHLKVLIAREKSSDAVRTACVEAIAAIGGPEATSLLVELAATDESALVRSSAIWALRNTSNASTALAEFSERIRAGRFRKQALVSLKATRLVGQPYSTEARDARLTDALIGNLVMKETIHVPYVLWWAYDSGWRGFSKGGSGGLRARRHQHFRWSQKIALIERPVPSQIVHDMLVKYTGVDYGYDLQAWRNWQRERNNSPTARRD